MPPRGRRPVGGPDTREQILAAAGELFSQLGFERTTMRAVAARADVDAALIHHYFVNKEGLLAAALVLPSTRPHYWLVSTTTSNTLVSWSFAECSRCGRPTPRPGATCWGSSASGCRTSTPPAYYATCWAAPSIPPWRAWSPR